MKQLALGMLGALLTAGGLSAEEIPALHIQTAAGVDSLALVTIRSITYEGETNMLVHTADTTLTYPITSVQLITLGTVEDGQVSALLHLRADGQAGTYHLYSPAGRLISTFTSLEQLRADLLQRPAGIYLIEADGQTSKLLKP